MIFRKATVVAAAAACILGVGIAQPAAAAPMLRATVASAATTSAPATQAPTVTIPPYSAGEKVTVEGTATPGASLEVTASSYPALLDTTLTVGDDGRWSFELTGGYALSVSVWESQPVLGGLVVTSASAYAGRTSPVVPFSSLAPLGSAVSTSPDLTGTGDPGATVSLLGGANTVLGSTTVGDDGVWHLKPDAPLPVGTFRGVVKETGSASLRSTSVVLNVDPSGVVVARAHTASVISAEQPFAITSSREFVRGERVTVSGTTTVPGADVTVYVAVGTQQIARGVAIADRSGAWSWTTPLALTGESYTVSAVQGSYTAVSSQTIVATAGPEVDAA
ncbi:hypothetical protein [Frondihabitans australicus]|uniref:Bacterial Ig domain-containing protein n=1 Tax=Frondihabitans australicus TaxID=386892 RepID=A0A495IE30_9MICO|nr:hypothetical protein [Frondihabitans australicus]RKR74264.1 hypothetical protein C8E83_1373 [Frondihabitans australicus]